MRRAFWKGFPLVTLKSDDGDYTFPVKAAGYVKLCDDEDLF